jgi:NDP-4-keto-2,6-dideoxyhexose 3-C-methyltransferase
MSIETSVGSRKMVLLENRPTVELVTVCRTCSGRLQKVGSLGIQYVVDFPEKGVRNGLRAPLDLFLCTSCKLVQLGCTVNPDHLFKKFWYRSGINPQMQKALSDVATQTLSLVGGLEMGDAVADIGSNDGTLLKLFAKNNAFGKDQRIHTVGFEPCDELVKLAEEEQSSEVIFNTYFKRGPAVDRLLHGWHQTGFKIIFALAMFYDLDNPVAFLKDVYDLLHQEGVFVIQMNYLPAMLRNNTFDNISHEHLCYYSLHTLRYLLAATGFRILDAETNDVNGGSIRIYAGVDLRPPLGGIKRVDVLLDAEQDVEQTLPEFFEHQQHISTVISSFVRTVSEMGQTVYVYGASTRGTTLLQTLDSDVWPLLLGAAERDDKKYGRCMVGTWTPIISEAEARAKANYFLVLPYHFLDGIVEREKTWMEGGGQFIVPLPVPRVISLDGERKLL